MNYISAQHPPPAALLGIGLSCIYDGLFCTYGVEGAYCAYDVGGTYDDAYADAGGADGC